MDATVAFVLKGYPRLSETFIAQEILALERLGLDLRLYSLRHPTDPHVHPIHRDIRAPVRYLPEYLHDEPRRVAAAWRAVRRRPGYRRAYAAWLRDLARDRSRNRVRRFGQALVLAHEMPADVGWLHAHFLHTPASVTRYAAMILDMPWSVSAHAKDIWTTPDWDVCEKLAGCRWAVACTQAGARHLSGLAPEPERVALVYHGLDPARFPPPPSALPSLRNGSDADDPVVLLSVGRAVAKKGYDVLLAALARLPAEVQWRLDHIGGGPLLADLQRRARELGIAGRVQWLGPQPQDVVLARYREADVFVLASRVAPDSDRDGLPNVLMEAQSQSVACLATTVSAIPELIIANETGLLVPSEDAAALGGAIERLIRTPMLRRRLGLAGMERVRARFTLDTGIARLARRFDVTVRATPPCASRSTRP